MLNCTLAGALLASQEAPRLFPSFPLCAFGPCRVPFGLGFAVCARVGSSLGAGRFKSAKLSAEVSMQGQLAGNDV